MRKLNGIMFTTATRVADFVNENKIEEKDIYKILWAGDNVAWSYTLFYWEGKD